MRFVCVWLALLCGCSFDRSGLSPTAIDQGRPLAFIDARLDQPDLLIVDAPSDDVLSDVTTDLRPPDIVVVPDSSPCIYEDFNNPLASWKVTLQRGDWVWKSSSSARQQKLNYFGAQALVQGSEPMVSSFTAETTCTVDDVYDNGYGQGAGLSLLVRKVFNNEPYRQVMCLTWLWGTTGSRTLALAHFQGKSKSAASFKTVSLGFSPVGKAVKYTMTVKEQGGVWTGTCTITSGANTESVTADISSIVDSPPLGVALLTTGVTVDFDDVKVCPKP